MKLSVTKAGVVGGLAVLALVPWLNGGREMPAMMTAYLVAILGVVLVWRLPAVRPLDRWLGYAWAGLIGLGFLSLFWSVNRYQSFVWSLLLTVAGALFVMSYNAAADHRTALVRAYLWLAAVVSLYGFWVYATEPYERLISLFSWANPAAAFLMPAVIIGTWQFARKRSRVLLVLTVVNVGAFLLTYSRGAIAVALVTALAAVLAVRPSRRVAASAFGVVLLGVALASGVHTVRTQIARQTSVDVATRVGEVVEGESTSVEDRLYFARSAFEIWRDYPVSGTGAGTYGSVHPQYQERVISASTNAHNFYLQTLSELGIIGFALLAAVVLLLLLGAGREVRANAAAGPAAAGLVALLVYLGLDTGASYPSVLFLSAVMAGLVYRPVAQEAGAPRRLYAGAAICLLAGLSVAAGSMYRSHLQARSGRWMQEEGDSVAAVEHFKQAHYQLVFDPDVVNAEGINYNALAQMGEDKELNLALARDRAEAAAKLDPRDAQHQFLLARVLRQGRDWGGAEAAYLRALELDPFNKPEYYVDLAGMYVELNRNDEAAATASRAIDMYPAEVIANRSAQVSVPQMVAQLYSLRALSKMRQRDEDGSRADLQLALQVDPGNFIATGLFNEFFGASSGESP